MLIVYLLRSHEEGPLSILSMSMLLVLQSNLRKRATAAKGRIHHKPDVWHCRHPSQNNLVTELT